jgi:NAD+ synthase (glutamine-hydrolysing)
MKYLKLAGAALNQIPLAFSHNVGNILSAIEQARAQEVAILCLPELCISGYGCEDTFYAPYVWRDSLRGLAEVARHSQGMTLSVGLPMTYEHSVFNVVALIHDGEVLGFVAKQELPGDGIYYEPRWFKPWPETKVVSYEWEGRSYPFGDLLFEIDGVRIGFEICEDAWNGIRPAQRHYQHNVDLILNPSASNFAFGKSRTRDLLVREASRGYACTYLYSNLLGNESGRIIYDGEILIAQKGELLARNRRFSYADAEIMTAVVDVEGSHLQRRRSFNFQPELPPHLIKVAYQYPQVDPQGFSPSIAPYESKWEEFYLAETLGLFDYMRKSRSRGFVLSLSGGADSSGCAVLCARAIQRAYDELGAAAFYDKLAYARLDEAQPWSEQLLTFVYQGTANSGEATLESARELARGLGAQFHHWDVEPVHQAYLGLAGQAMGRPLTWEQDDITLQNIQARLRAPGIWMLANLHQALLITTSNRSEAAVGYATMDGDTSGGLAPLGGIDKHSLLQWLRWAETALDVPALHYVNALQPTAELRPADATQSDEGDLMPYQILDEIEKCGIRDYQSPVEVFRSLRGRYPDQQLKGYIVKFFRLWSRNQWKRERYAPSFHLDDANLDPKTWCRFPILNGGFEKDLQALDQYVESLQPVIS